MTNRSTPNLPALDVEATSRFYQQLGFEEGWRDDGWMILTRDTMTLEFFPHPDLKPAESCFSCCLRLDDMDTLYAVCRDAGVPEQCWGWPRLHPPTIEESGLRIGYLLDPNGSLIRLIQNEP